MNEIEIQCESSHASYRVDLVIHIGVPSKDVRFVRTINTTTVRDREPAEWQLEAGGAPGEL